MKRILVALDSSPRAPAVLAAADRLAELAGGSLIVYRAVNVPPDMPRDVLETSDERLEDRLMRNAYSDLERLTADIPAARIGKLVATFATPWDGICSAARDHAVDLVVIGAHGYGKLDRLLGTTAAKVVNHCDKSLFVVRSPL